ncbi:MAG: hypothetical protein R2851_02060 [Caldilineaceae bacterium]
MVITTYPYYQSPLAAICQLPAPPRILTVVTDFVSTPGVVYAGADFCRCGPADAARRAVSAGLTRTISGSRAFPSTRTLAGYARPNRTCALAGTDLPTLLVMGSKRVDRLPGLLQQISGPAAAATGRGLRRR